MSKAIVHLDSLSQLNGILGKSKDRVSVIDFHASWCGPCHAIAPVYDALAIQYNKHINFLKCDVDAAKEVASFYGVSAMPTFIFLRGSTKIHQIRGANRRELEDSVRKYSTDSGTNGTSAFSGKGHTLGGAAVPVNPKREIKDAANSISAKVVNIDPQLKVLIGLVCAYVLLVYVL
ncbi:thioredoxin-like protein [Mycena floridula]|nr:thioredoxin-like protein [Mycena floridula]